jgi:sugar O-acyltransferase (sialic acid O-acetyltransferase NeuD family)
VINLVGVYGSGGCGRGILPLIRDELIRDQENLVFVDDRASPGRINGHEIMSWNVFLATPALGRTMCIGIASPPIREMLAAKCDAAGIALRGARAKSLVIMDDVTIGEGACLSPFVTLTSNIQIGRCFHANLYSYVEHDAIIGDFVTFAPGAKCNGNVRIEDRAYVGSGAVIKQGLVIGHDAVIGMGAVVTRDVPPNAIVVGNPARPLEKG